MRRNRKLPARKPRRPKMRLGLLDLDQSRSAVVNSLRSPEPQRGYRHSMDELIGRYCSEPRLSFNKTVVTRYRIHLESRYLRRGRSTSDWQLSADWLTKLPTPGCSAPNSPRAYVASRGRKNSVSDLGIG
jgi:hypothetical protein